jgi:hypothetical protein
MNRTSVPLSLALNLFRSLQGCEISNLFFDEPAIASFLANQILSKNGLFFVIMCSVDPTATSRVYDRSITESAHSIDPTARRAPIDQPIAPTDQNERAGDDQQQRDNSAWLYRYSSGVLQLLGEQHPIPERHIPSRGLQARAPVWTVDDGDDGRGAAGVHVEHQQTTAR